jgi:hypothetical protein
VSNTIDATWKIDSFGNWMSNSGIYSTVFSAGTVSGGTFYSGNTELSTLFLGINGRTKVQPGINTYTGGTYNFPTVNISALTIDNISVSANSLFNTLSATSLSATSLSAGTYFSGSTPLDSIMYNLVIANSSKTKVQPGLNTYTGGTFTNPTVNISALTIDNISVSANSLFNILSATSLSAGTYFSGSTPLDSIMYNLVIANSSNTRIQPGLNTYTGGTSTNPTVNVSALTIQSITISGVGIYNTLSGVSFTAGTINSGATNIQSLFAKVGNENFISLSATSFSAGTYFSGSTPLDSIIYSIAINLDNASSSTGNTYIQNGLNTYTGGTQSRPTVNISALTINSIIVSGSSNFVTLSATSFSAGTINSGNTEISNLFLNVNGGTKVQPGLNTYTGGTYNFPTINISALTVNTITASGTSIFTNLSAISFSAGIIYSGGSELSSLLIGNNLWSSSTGVTSIIARRVGNTAGDYAVALGQNNTAQGVGSFIGGGEKNNVYLNAKYGIILGGSGNTLQSGATNSVILGQTDFTGTTANTVYVQNIEATTYYSGGIDLNTIFLAVFDIVDGGIF